MLFRSETAMTLRDERDNALDELASYVDISYKENSDGIVKVSVEGVEFVDEARCYEMGKNPIFFIVRVEFCF